MKWARNVSLPTVLPVEGKEGKKRKNVRTRSFSRSNLCGVTNRRHEELGERFDRERCRAKLRQRRAVLFQRYGLIVDKLLACLGQHTVNVLEEVNAGRSKRTHHRANDYIENFHLNCYSK